MAYDVTVTLSSEEAALIRQSLLIHRVDDQISLRKTDNSAVRAMLTESIAKTEALLAKLTDATAKAELRVKVA